MLPRFYFAPEPERHPTVAERLLDSASHAKIDLWKADEGVVVRFEISGTFNDGPLGEPIDPDLTRSALGTVRELVRVFAASGKGGA